MMRGFIDKNGNYYEAEENITGAREVPRRATSWDAWDDVAGSWTPGVQPPAEIEAEDSAAALRELAALDLASIRDIRAYIAAKPDAPAMLKDQEALAVAARARVRV